MSKRFSEQRRTSDWSALKRHGEEYAVIKDQGILFESPGWQQIEPCQDEVEVAMEDQWLDVRLQISAVLLDGAVTVDPRIRGGIPVLRDTRITLAQVLIEIADGGTIYGFAEEYDIETDVVKEFFEGLAIHLDRSFVK